MNHFAHLLDRLAYEPGRNAKLRLLQDFFASTPDPERGWALAAMTGTAHDLVTDVDVELWADVPLAPLQFRWLQV